MKSWDLGQEFDKKQIEVTAQFLADSLAEDIEERRRFVSRGSCRVRGDCRPLIEAPPRVQEMWAREIALTSGQAVFVMDQINVFLNGGNVTSSRLYGLGSSDREMMDVLVSLSEFFRKVDRYVYTMIPHFLTMLRNEDVEQLIGQYELEAICFYDKAAQSKSTFFKKFTEMVSKDQYSEYVKELFGAVQQMFKSDKLEKNIILVYEKIVDELKQIDVNACTGKLYFFLLNFRGFLLNIDIQQVITHINQIYREFDEGMWKTSHGEWPEMAKCLDNIIRLSFGSREFWVKLGILSNMCSRFLI